MNMAHLHLILNHFPLIFSVAALVLWLAAKIFKSDGYRKSALLLCVLTGVLAGPAYLTGGEAEEQVENLPGYSQSQIHEHEEAGEKALISSIVLSLVAAGAIWRERKGNPPAWVYWAPFVVLLITIASHGYAANLGGMIKHDEVRKEAGA